MANRFLILVALGLSAKAFADPPRFVRLYAESATASSFLQNDWNRFTENYHPNYALDDDPKTAWVEGVDGNGEGERLTFGVSPLASARAVKVELRAGYHKSKALFLANAAPKSLRVSLLGLAGQPVVTRTVELPRKLDWQAVELELPKGEGFAAVELKILSVHPGTKYKDTCISDVRMSVDSDVPYNAKAEQAKRELLHGWIKERLAAAKYFKSLPKQYPFAATHFHGREVLNEGEEEVDDGKVDETFRSVQERITGGQSHRLLDLTFTADERKRIEELLMTAAANGLDVGAGWSKVAFNRKIHLPDGLSGVSPLEEGAGYLARDGFALFEAVEAEEKGRTLLATENHGGLLRASSLSNLRVSFMPAQAAVESESIPEEKKTLRTVYFREFREWRERTTYRSTRHFVLQFGPGERLEEIRVLREGESWAVELVQLRYDSAGRVDHVIKKSAFFCCDEYEGANLYDISEWRARH